MRIANILGNYKKDSNVDVFDSLIGKFKVKSLASEISNKLDVPIDTFSKVKIRITAHVKEADKNIPIIAAKEAYEVLNKLALEFPENKGIQNIAFHVKTKFNNDPSGFFTLANIEDIQKYADKVLPKRMFAKSSQIVYNSLSNMIKSSIKNRFDIAKLNKIAESIGSQDDYDSAMEINGFSIDRSDIEEIREYIAYKVNTRLNASVVNTDYFVSANKVKRNLEKISGNLVDGDYDILHGITEGNWADKVAEKKEASKLAKEKLGNSVSDLFTSHSTLQEALNKSDIAYHKSAKDNKTYIVRKDIFGGFNLYSAKDNKDAILIDRFPSLEELSNDITSIPNVWSV